MKYKFSIEDQPTNLAATRPSGKGNLLVDIKVGHNPVEVYFDKNGKKRIRKQINDTWEHETNIPTKRLAKKEETVSKIGKILKMDIPEVKHIEQDGKHYTDAEFIEGKNLNEFPLMTDWNKHFKTLDRHSLVKSVLLNWLVNGRDLNHGNFRITPDNKLIPIDHEYTFHEAKDEPEVVRQEDPVKEHFLKGNHNRFLKSYITNILFNKKKILDTIEHNLKPHYNERDHAMLNSLMNDKFRTLEMLSRKDNLTHDDLNYYLK
jgi:hypothetical protein